MTRRRGYVWAMVVLAALAVLLIDHHWQQVGLNKSWRVPVNALAFLWLFATVVFAHANKTFTGSATVATARVTVLVPLYNEDPVTFRQMLDTLDAQTRKPDRVHIVDDGSSSVACQAVFDKWRKETTIAETEYTYKTNAGKREAQAVAIRADSTADVFVTIDSDTVLDTCAIEEGLRPFDTPRVMSVAGMLVGLNSQRNLLTGLTDLGFVSSFLNGRSAWSRLHTVSVNCGGLAFYRAWVVRKHLDEYLNQTVCGKRAASGDDRIMTNFALLEGWTVFQESSVGYTLLPERFGHLTRQHIRWWRSFFWGSVWLIRRFPPNRLVWWLVTWQLTTFAIYTVVIPTVLIVNPALTREVPIALFVYIAVVSYIRDARYLSLRRPDQSFARQLAMYLLSPLCSLLNFYLCTVLQYIGLATVAHTQWGTRSVVEVTAEPNHLELVKA